MARRVLVVEDEAALRFIVAECLRQAGFEVVEASNGLEGLEVARAQTPDLIVLDLMMPLMGGKAFVEASRADAGLASVPIVVLSAALGLVDAPDRAAVAASLNKPFDLDVMLATIERVLEQSATSSLGAAATPLEPLVAEDPSDELLPGASG